MIGSWMMERSEVMAERSWSWLTDMIPDIMGYGALVAGGAIIISSMVGDAGIIKPITYYACGIILAICILL